MSEWLTNLKVGDEVVVINYGIGSGPDEILARVERCTATLIIVHGRYRCCCSKFRKSDGHQPGAGSGGSFLAEPTQEKKDSIARWRHVAYFKKFDWSTLSLETLRAIFTATQV